MNRSRQTRIFLNNLNLHASRCWYPIFQYDRCDGLTQRSYIRFLRPGSLIGSFDTELSWSRDPGVNKARKCIATREDVFAISEDKPNRDTCVRHFVVGIAFFHCAFSFWGGRWVRCRCRAVVYGSSVFLRDPSIEWHAVETVSRVDWRLYDVLLILLLI